MFAETAKQFFPWVLYNAIFSAHFHMRRLLSATKATNFTPDLPHQDPRCAEAESNAGVILPTHNDLHIKPRGQQPTLFSAWFLYL